jgi:glycosyltransferase involved in cell wall biosynthesis
VHVVVVVPGGVDRGGRERVIPALLWLIESLARRHRVTVVALGQEPQPSRYRLLGATVVNVPPEEQGSHRLARMIARGVRAAGSEGRPDVVAGFWASVSGLVAVAAAARHRVPSVVHVAGGELVALPELGYGGALGRGGRLITALTLRRADRITVATNWMADHVRAAGHRVDRVIPLGVDTTRFSPMSSADAQARPHLVHVGSLNRVKDQTTLIHALAIARRSVPGLTADLVGVDTLSGEHARLARTLGLGDAVRFTGFVPSDELPELLRPAALHVLSSRHDAGPVAVLEAAACGVPTVGTAVGHVADLAGAQPPGARAVPPGDPSALAGAIVELLGDQPQRRELAAVALDFAQRHDREATAAAFEHLYKELRASSRRREAASSGEVPRCST